MRICQLGRWRGAIKKVVTLAVSCEVRNIVTRAHCLDEVLAKSLSGRIIVIDEIDD